MVKVYESYKPNRTGMTYLKAVEESIRRLREFYNSKGRAVSEGELVHACKEGLGSTWTYDARLDCCVDERFAVGNRGLRREGDQITVTEDDWQNITQQATAVNTRSGADPNFRGTWGTEINADNKIDTATPSGLARTVVGVDPAQNWPNRKTEKKVIVRI